MDKFSTEIFGYNKKEVHEFVNDTVSRTEEWIKRLEEADFERKRLLEEINQYKANEETLRLALESAIRNQDIVKKNAYHEAEAIVNHAKNIERQAKENADRILSYAIVRSEKIENRSTMMKNHIEKSKNQLRTIMEQHEDIILQMEDIEYDNY